MSNTVLAQGAGNILGVILLAAIFIGSAILRARAEAKARERRQGAADEGKGAEAVPPEVHAILRQIGRETGPQGIPVGRPLPFESVTIVSQKEDFPEGRALGRPAAGVRNRRRSP